MPSLGYFRQDQRLTRPKQATKRRDGLEPACGLAASREAQSAPVEGACYPRRSWEGRGVTQNCDQDRAA